MKHVSILLLNCLLYFSVQSQLGKQATAAQISVINDFIYNYAGSAIASAAHPSSTYDGYKSMVPWAYDFYIDNEYTYDGNVWVCSYDITLTGNYITNFKVVHCGSPDDYKCFDGCNDLKSFSTFIYDLLNSQDKDNQNQTQSAMQKIQNWLEEQLKKKLEDLTCDDYTFGYLAYEWAYNDYNTKYANASNIINDYNNDQAHDTTTTMSESNISGDEPQRYYYVPNTIARAYFHNEPDESTKRNAYLVTGAVVYVQKIDNGFGYIEFTNDQGQTSIGWIDLNDLVEENDLK